MSGGIKWETETPTFWTALMVALFGDWVVDEHEEEGFNVFSSGSHYKGKFYLSYLSSERVK